MFHVFSQYPKYHPKSEGIKLSGQLRTFPGLAEFILKSQQLPSAAGAASVSWQSVLGAE